MDNSELYISFSILAVGQLLLLSRLGLKTWFLIHSGLCLAFGTGHILMPNQANEIINIGVNVELDSLHLFLIRCGGIIGVFTALQIFLNYKCVDRYTTWTILFGRALAGTIQILVISFTLHELPGKPKGKEDDGKLAAYEDLKYLIGLEVLNTLGNLFFICKGRDSGGHSQLHSRINMHLRADFFLQVVHGIMCLAFPKVILAFVTNKTAFDAIHLMMVQIFGGMFIGAGTISLLTTSFLFTVNKRHVLLCRCLEALGFIVVILYTQTMSDAFVGSNQIGLLVCGLASFNALLGYYSPHETDSYISKDD